MGGPGQAGAQGMIAVVTITIEDWLFWVLLVCFVVHVALRVAEYALQRKIARLDEAEAARALVAAEAAISER